MPKRTVAKLSVDATVNESRPTPKNMARAAEKRVAAMVWVNTVGLLPNGDLSGIIGISSVLEHALALGGDALCASGACLL